MAMTLTQLRTEVRQNILRDVNSEMTNARVDRHINWAQQRVADRHTFEEMKVYTTDTTVDGQKRYSFPTRMKDFVSITVQDGASSRKLDYIWHQDFDLLIPRPEETTEDCPLVYVDYGTEYELYPIPDTTYTLNQRYSQYPEDLSADADESDLLRKDHVIVACATGMAFYALAEMDMGGYWNTKVFPEYLAEAVESDHSAGDWTPVARGHGAPSSGALHALGADYWTSPFLGR